MPGVWAGVAYAGLIDLLETPFSRCPGPRLRGDIPDAGGKHWRCAVERQSGGTGASSHTVQRPAVPVADAVVAESLVTS
jgi:hypothetical protein